MGTPKFIASWSEVRVALGTQVVAASQQSWADKAVSWRTVHIAFVWQAHCNRVSSIFSTDKYVSGVGKQLLCARHARSVLIT